MRDILAAFQPKLRTEPDRPYFLEPDSSLRVPRVHAASRKTAIVSFHLQGLIATVQLHQPLPVIAPIDVQAHFEGILYAYVAATDQIEEAVKYLGLSQRPRIRRGTPGWERFKLIVGALQDSPVRSALLHWADDPFFADARWVRNQATHAHYEKRTPHRDMVAIGDWEVQSPSGATAPPPFGGSRYLRDYGRVAHDHIMALRRLLPDLDRQLRSRSPGTAPFTG
jgi:hypothetical protein